MNKQDALVALLTMARQWETASGNPKADDEQVLGVLSRNYVRLLDLTEGGKDDRAELIAIAAAALYLLVDEVEVVEGRSLEEWLADNRDRVGNGERSKLRTRPQPINGAITGPSPEPKTLPGPGRHGPASWWPEGLR
jgi:hypothetical protein